MYRPRAILLSLLIAPTLLWGDSIPYTIEFEGISDHVTLMSIKQVSRLVSMKKRAPSSINALRFRADSDIPEIRKVLRAAGYYEPKVCVRINELGSSAEVLVKLSPGPLYTLSSYDIELYTGSPDKQLKKPVFQLKELGLCLGGPARAGEILEAEKTLMRRLKELGYPLAKIAHREVIVDGATKSVTVELKVDSGRKSRFGALEIEGAQTVKRRLFDEKIQWKEGALYDARLVDATQRKLFDTGVFSSVLVTHEEDDEEESALPMKIDVVENKHRSINLGVSYQTFFGPGISFGWQHRNIGGMGRKLTIQGEVTQRSHTGIAKLLTHDFYRVGQDYTIQAEAQHESITPYSQRAYSVLNRFDKQMGKALRFSIGVNLEYLDISDSSCNGHFKVVELPIYFRVSSANNLLNPTRGDTLEYRIIPTYSPNTPGEGYLMQQLTLSSYKRLARGEYLVFAQKFVVGSIFSESLKSTPLSKRFLGGSEEELRGYKHRTVSPLDEYDRATGGRSAVYYTAELRMRFGSIGLVPFFDIGNVYHTITPTFKGKWLKSVGLGLRYFTFMGPLRIDVARPLDRRSDIDPRYRIFLSLGQTF